MTTISAKIIADSISEHGKRITTMQLRYPRWIHAEFMTHRHFSRNASSSRAVPVERLIKDILEDPAIPMFWGKNQKGMQGGEECNVQVRTLMCVKELGLRPLVVSRESAWLHAMTAAIASATAFDEAGYHKQIVNRLLEPFSHINVVVTATEWSNFYALRRHRDAEPHIHLLADKMWEAQQASKPVLLKEGKWHAPYAPHDAFARIPTSVACCASVSYKTVEGLAMTQERAVALHDKLVGNVPLHASPCEHQATPDGAHWSSSNDEWLSPELHGNFVGWIQYRKTLKGECQ